MARVRNITDQELELRVAGAVVKPDELVDVPDDVYRAHEWPETVWKTESKPDNKKKG